MSLFTLNIVEKNCILFKSWKYTINEIYKGKNKEEKKE